jgi:hypothetical protein
VGGVQGGGWGVGAVQLVQQYRAWYKLGAQALAVGGVLQDCEQEADQLQVLYRPGVVVQVPAGVGGWVGGWRGG